MKNIYLYINTASASEIIIGLINNSSFLVRKKIKAPRRQSEKLLVSIDKLLSDYKIQLNKLSGIIVADKGDSFTSLRIGVLTANALAYGLNISVQSEGDMLKTGLKLKKRKSLDVVEPIYERPANIGVSKK
jgi:tRNA A37 threonylcarbamoyladenosine modification protein TsaB